MRAAGLLCLGLLTLLAGCRRPQPSLEFTEASGLHSTLVARLGDDAYADAEMERVDALLDRVPAESSDATAAAELKRFIGSERKRIAQEAADQERRLGSLLDQPDLPSSPRAPEPTPALETADGGAEPSWELTAGMTTEEVSKTSGDCFSSSGAIKLRRPDKTELDGEIWERRDTGTCRERYAQYGGRVLVFRNGKLAGNFAKTEVQTEPGPKPPLPTAPPPGSAAPGQAPAEPPAPAPAPQPFYPGAPLPGTPPVSPGENTGPAPAP